MDGNQRKIVSTFQHLQEIMPQNQSWKEDGVWKSTLKGAINYILKIIFYFIFGYFKLKYKSYNFMLIKLNKNIK